MAEEVRKFAVIFDPEKGLQLLDLETNEIADLAVLEGTWRRMGEDLPREESPEQEVKGQVLQITQPGLQPLGVPLRQYGQLRIRSSGSLAYDIWISRQK